MPKIDYSTFGYADWPCTEIRWDMSVTILLIFLSRLLQAKLRRQSAGVLTCYESAKQQLPPSCSRTSGKRNTSTLDTETISLPKFMLHISEESNGFALSVFLAIAKNQ